MDITLVAAMLVSMFLPDWAVRNLKYDTRRVGLFAVGSAVCALVAIACLAFVHGLAGRALGFVGVVCAGIGGGSLSHWQKAKEKSKREGTNHSSRAA